MDPLVIQQRDLQLNVESEPDEKWLIYVSFTLHGTSGYSATGPLDLSRIRTTQEEISITINNLL